ncbi:hypothetical protein PINS_up011196 [Pythium insidiosum]|nr:hypothetical protein PINS_up011196 [Pythium insidiosum]
MPHESSVLRYFESRVMLRLVATDDYDPHGASFSEFGSTERAPFVSLLTPPPHSAAALLLRTPTIAVVPSVAASPNRRRLATAVFTIVPAAGFDKEHGQPVCYNDPIELVDQHGRPLGIAARSPYNGHLAADGHNGALVFVLERHTTRLQPISNRLLKHEELVGTEPLEPTSTMAVTAQLDLQRKLGLLQRRRSSRSSLVEVCGGDRLRIPGLVCLAKKQFPDGLCVMQSQQSQDDQMREYLMCEVVLTSAPTTSTSETTAVPVKKRSSPKKKKNAAEMTTDRTATGDFVAVLHSGELHRRADVTKLWRPRFYVLTQVALHRFDASVTLATAKLAKPRGVLLLRDCRAVRYERFARPHELEIELVNGKTLSFHSREALACAKWASVLAHAIENPQWVYAERGLLTVWRSDAQFSSSKCPTVAKLVLRRAANAGQDIIVASSPQWSDKLSLGAIRADDYVTVVLSDGQVFHLSLEDLIRSLLQANWVTMRTSMAVGRIQDMESSGAIPDELSDTIPRRSDAFGMKMEASTATESQFLVRLKFRTDLHLDQRLRNRRSFWVDAVGALVVLVVVLAPGGFLCRTSQSFGSLSMMCGLTSLAIVVVGLLVFGPILWQYYWRVVCDHSIEAELFWFITLLALEIHPQTEDDDSWSLVRDRDESCSLSTLDTDDDDYRLSHEQSHRSSAASALRISELSPSIMTECDMASPECIENRCRHAPDTHEIRRFRLENGLDAILGRPQLSFFAIKQFFPIRLLPRDEAGRRVLLLDVRNVNWRGLAAHNVTTFNVARQLMYIGEFMWSYQDLLEGRTHSELKLVVDSSGWRYTKWFSREMRFVLLAIHTLHRYYPKRVSGIEWLGDSFTFPFYSNLIKSCLPMELRGKLVTQQRVHDASTLVIDPSRDEVALKEFVTALLSTFANVTIPPFTRREIEQATHFAKFGSLDSFEESSAVGTRALLLPEEDVSWRTVCLTEAFDLYRSVDEKAPLSRPTVAFQSDARVAQWRGRLRMRTQNVNLVFEYLHNPSLWKLWYADGTEMFVLDQLSRREEICFWSRRVPFMSFTMPGHRYCRPGCEIKRERNAYFDCVVRRIFESRKQTLKSEPEYTLLWKTTSAQRAVLDATEASESSGDVAAAGRPVHHVVLCRGAAWRWRDAVVLVPSTDATHVGESGQADRSID